MLLGWLKACEGEVRPMQLTIPVPEGQDAIRIPAGVLRWSEEEFFLFCQANRDLQIERSAKGEIIVMPPAGGYASF
jgi:Uma2 family endonuclease